MSEGEGSAAASVPGGASVPSSSGNSSKSALTIDDHIDNAALQQKLNPSAPAPPKSTGYLMAKIDYQKPILRSLLSECPQMLHPFLPYDSSYERTIEVIKKWYKPDTGSYTVSLLPSQSEIDSADLVPLYKVIMAFVKDRLGLKDQKSNVFSEKITSSSVVVACVLFTTLVKIFNGASGADLIHKLTAYQSFIGSMQAHLLDRYDADSGINKSLKSVRGKSNNPTGQSAFACLNQCSLTAEKKKKEVRHTCFKESLPRVDGIHSTLSNIRKNLLLLFIRIHHNTQIPLDFDYLLNGDPEQSVEKPSPIFMNNSDIPIGLSPESAQLLRIMKKEGIFNELFNVATQQLAAVLDRPNANQAVEFAIGAKSVIDQTKTITYSVMLGESGLLKKLQVAELSMKEKDQTSLMYPMLMAEFEHTPTLFLASVIMRKMTSDLFMAQIQLANLTPIVASEAIEAYTLALAEFGTSLRDFITRLAAARDHIASMHRFGFELNYVGTTLLSKLIDKEDEGASQETNSTLEDPATTVSAQGVTEFLRYWQTITSFKTDKHSLRYLNEVGKLCEELQQNVDTLCEHIKVLRNSTDVVKSYAMIDQAITDLRKFSNAVTNATGKQLTVHDQPLDYFKQLLENQSQLVTSKRAALRAANDISLALSQGAHSAAYVQANGSSSSVPIQPDAAQYQAQMQAQPLAAMHAPEEQKEAYEMGGYNPPMYNLLPSPIVEGVPQPGYAPHPALQAQGSFHALPNNNNAGLPPLGRGMSYQELPSMDTSGRAEFFQIPRAQSLTPNMSPMPAAGAAAIAAGLLPPGGVFELIPGPSVPPTNNHNIGPNANSGSNLYADQSAVLKQFQLPASTNGAYQSNSSMSPGVSPVYRGPNSNINNFDNVGETNGREYSTSRPASFIYDGRMETNGDYSNTCPPSPTHEGCTRDPSPSRSISTTQPSTLKRAGTQHEIKNVPRSAMHHMYQSFLHTSTTSTGSSGISKTGGKKMPHHPASAHQLHHHQSYNGPHSTNDVQTIDLSNEIPQGPPGTQRINRGSFSAKNGPIVVPLHAE